MEIYCKQSTMRSQLAKAAIKADGSVTVESAFVIPVVLLTVCLILYMTILLFERCMLINSTNYAAIMASSSWKDPDSLDIDWNNYNLYWRIFDEMALTKSNKAAQNTEAYYKLLGLKGFTVVNSYADYRNSIIKSIETGIFSRTVFPEQIIMKQFNLSSAYGLKINSCSIIPDFSEFIRNIDFVIDIEKELEENSPEFKNFAKNYNEILEKIRGFIDGII